MIFMDSPSSAVLTSCPLVVNPIIGLQFTYLHDNAFNVVWW